MRVLGLDQSYTKSGLVVLNEQGEMIDFTIISSDVNQQEFTRAMSIASKIQQFTDSHNITNAMMEGLAFGSRGDATRMLAGLQFTIATYLKVISKQHLSIEIVPPTTLKKFATGGGKADKNMMIASLPQEIKQQFLDKGYLKTKGLPDLTDAYFIAKYAHAKLTS